MLTRRAYTTFRLHLQYCEVLPINCARSLGGPWHAKTSDFSRSSPNSVCALKVNKQLTLLSLHRQVRSNTILLAHRGCTFLYAPELIAIIGQPLMVSTAAMQTFSERLASFEVAHPATKKRTSSAKNVKTLHWPHKAPAPAKVSTSRPEWTRPR